MRARPRPVALLAVALWLAPSLSLADAATEAQLQYELGAQLYQAGKYTEALERFIASHRLVPNPNVVLNVVQTFTFLKRYDEAYNWNETYLSFTKEESKRAEGIKRREALSKSVAVIDVSTSPPGAELFVDRVELGSVGRSPLRIAVSKGDRVVIARLDKHDDQSAPVTAKNGAAVTASLKLTAAMGWVTVRTTPAGATVRDEQSHTVLGTTPAELRLPVGEHRLELTLGGWVNASRSVTVGRNARLALEVELQRAAASATLLSVRGNVDGATVLLNGRPLGAAPLSIDTLPAGSGVLEVRALGREPWKERVVLEQGSATRVSYSLVDPDDRPWAGWRWVGYGAGTALLGAGALFGLSARSAKSDFDDEPSRTALDRVEQRNLVADVLMGAGVLTIGATVTWDLLRAAPPESSGRVSVDR
ncbi:MAG: PEGA domain-containing protein [Myxococcales bacterium]|nr:PEGA domain-containing protein [Myxococcales bacterium]